MLFSRLKADDAHQNITVNFHGKLLVTNRCFCTGVANRVQLPLIEKAVMTQTKEFDLSFIKKTLSGFIS